MDVNFLYVYCMHMCKVGNGNDLLHNERHLIKIVLKHFAVRMQHGTVAGKHIDLGILGSSACFYMCHWG